MYVKMTLITPNLHEASSNPSSALGSSSHTQMHPMQPRMALAQPTPVRKSCSTASTSATVPCSLQPRPFRKSLTRLSPSYQPTCAHRPLLTYRPCPIPLIPDCTASKSPSLSRPTAPAMAAIPRALHACSRHTGQLLPRPITSARL